MRRIQGRNGRVLEASDGVASGMVASGRAVYVDDADSPPAKKRRNTRARTSNGPAKKPPVKQPQQSGEAATDAGPTGDAD